MSRALTLEAHTRFARSRQAIEAGVPSKQPDTPATPVTPVTPAQARSACAQQLQICAGDGRPLIGASLAMSMQAILPRLQLLQREHG